MQSKIDSLESIVTKTEIGTGFFSEIISLQLGVFLFLVSLAGFLSWKWFQNRIDETKNYCISHSDTTINKMKNAYDDNFQKVIKNLHKTIFDSNRAMYLLAEKSNDKIALFVWSLSCDAALFNYKPDYTSEIIKMLRICNQLSRYISVRNPKFLASSDNIFENLNILSKCEDITVKESVAAVLENVNHIIHSMTESPENENNV